jgi:hypothetical protein
MNKHTHRITATGLRYAPAGTTGTVTGTSGQAPDGDTMYVFEFGSHAILVGAADVEAIAPRRPRPNITMYQGRDGRVTRTSDGRFISHDRCGYRVGDTFDELDAAYRALIRHNDGLAQLRSVNR